MLLIYCISLYTGFEEIRKKVPNHEAIIAFYKEQIEAMNCFVRAKSNCKWIINESYKKSDVV